MKNKSNNTRNIIGIALVILIGLVVWSMAKTQAKQEFEKLGLVEYEKGNYRGAGEYYDLGIVANSGNASLYNNRGLVYFKLKEYKKALSDYNKAIILKPDFATAYCNRGLAHFKSTRVPGVKNRKEVFNKAIMDFTKAIELNPTFADAYYNRGISRNQFYIHRGKPFKKDKDSEDKYQKALADFDKALEIDPEFVLAFAGKGNAYYRYGNWNEAAAEYTKAIKLKDKIIAKWDKKALAGVFASSGRNYLALNELEKSGSDYEKVLELDSSSTAPSGHGASVWFKLKNYDKLVEAYSNIINLIENDPEFKDYSGAGRSYAGRAKTYYMLGRYDKAIADSKKALASGSHEGHGYDIAEVYRFLGKTYLETGNIKETEKEFKQAIKLYTDKTGSRIKRLAISGYTGLGLCYLNLKEYGKAMENFEKVIELNTPYKLGKSGGYAEAKKNLGLVYWKMGKIEKADEYFKNAIKLFEKEEKKYSAKALQEALKTGDIAGLLK
ncbi:MAG: tetratricopeptide repeat protein [Deltaproteobacteria bacterium]|nr:tetratricopeptide repeat protein [Deltaproteobacteria bacterium]